MKRILLMLLACGFAGFLATSCVKDKGNYEYGDEVSIFDVSIRSFADMGYSNIALRVGGRLTIEPEITGDRDCTYEWFLITGINKASRNTLSREKILDIDLPPSVRVGNYNLYLEVTKDGKVQQTAPILVSVEPQESKLSLQWFILKENSDGVVDFDFYDPTVERPATTKYEGLQPDIMKTHQIPSPTGSAVSIGYMPNFGIGLPNETNPEITTVYYWAKGAISPQNGWQRKGYQGVICVVASDSMQIIDVENLAPIGTWKSYFYEKPQGYEQITNATTSPWEGTNYDTFNGSAQVRAMWIVMDEQLYLSSSYKLSATENAIPGAVTRDDNKPYRMHSQFIRTYGYYYTTIVFDMASHSFLYTGAEPSGAATLVEYPTISPKENWPQNANGNYPDPNPIWKLPELTNMDYDLVQFVNDQYSPATSGAANHVCAMMRGYEGSPKEGETVLLLPGSGKYDSTYASANIGVIPTTYPFERMHVIPEGDWKILDPKAKLHLHGSNDLMLWFALGNKFYSYDTNDVVAAGVEREKVVLELPEDEEIVYFYQYTVGMYDMKKVVLSNTTDGRWKLRVYDIGKAGAFNAGVMDSKNDLMDPQYMKLICEGEGKAKQAILTSSVPYRSYFN